VTRNQAYLAEYGDPDGSATAAYDEQYQAYWEQYQTSYNLIMNNALLCIQGLQNAYDGLYNSAITRFNSDQADAENLYFKELSSCTANE
jgi:hypothetical protein